MYSHCIKTFDYKFQFHCIVVIMIMVQFNSSKIVQKYTKICAEKFLLKLLDKLLIYKQTLSIRKYRTDSNFTTKIMHMNIFTSKKVMRKRHGKFGQLLFWFSNYFKISSDSSVTKFNTFVVWTLMKHSPSCLIRF